MPNERILHARAVSAKSFVGFLRPKISFTAFTLSTYESVLFEERNRELFFVDFHFTDTLYAA